MKTTIFTLLIILFSAYSYSQVIPYSNTQKIYNTDTGSVINAFKIPVLQTGTKNLYIQRGGAYSGYNVDLRYGNIYRMLQGYFFSDAMHNGALKNKWTFVNGYNIGYTVDMSFSMNDTNTFLFSYIPPDWEPYAAVYYSTNNGLNTISVFSQNFMAQCGGVCIDPFNDSIMYAAYRFGSSTSATLHKSTNRGANWFDLDTINIAQNSKLYVNPSNRSTIFFCNGNQIYRSTQGGYNFQIVVDSIQNAKLIFNYPQKPFYGISTTPGKGLIRFTNNGANWTMVNEMPLNDLEIDSVDTTTFYGAANNGIYKSINRGKLWTLYNNAIYPQPYIHSIMKNTYDGDTLIAVSTKGVYKVFGKAIRDTANSSYIPLKVGNVYKYLVHALPAPDYYIKLRITSTEVINGYTFFNFSGYIPGTSVNKIRYDSLSGITWGYSQNFGCSGFPNQIPLDSLSSKYHDTLKYCYGGSFTNSFCQDTNTFTVFGNPVKSKRFYENNMITHQRTYSKGFGITFASTTEVDNYQYILTGAYINNVLYGDTTLTGVELISSEVPTEFVLKQNYPNPFNPITRIHFSVPKAELVTIKIYDITGREIKTLVSETKQTGEYSVDFNADNFSSGVYFYKMQAGTFTDVKRMLLIK